MYFLNSQILTNFKALNYELGDAKIAK